MNDTNKAVFLSYTSQDSEAAKRICDALRQAGVEVWFDQSELRGGDAWDAKIKRQIKNCALFVPVISQHTQERLEGYFRREWRLAVDRTHDMAEEKAFLVPVVIDGTTDTAASVPDKFREVQWTRLLGGETPQAFVERVKALLQPEASGEGHEARGQAQEAGSRPAKVERRKAAPPWRWLVPTLGGIAVVLALALWQPWQKHLAKPAPAEIKPPAAQPAAPTKESEARQLVARARTLALYDQWDEATREDFALTEQLLKRAVELDPIDGDAWAAYALCSCGQIAFGYDSSQTRKEAARNQAERAVKLAPDSNQALFALAYSYRYQQTATKAEALRLHRQVAEREPANKFVLRQLGRVLQDTGDAANNDEALVWWNRAAVLPGGDPLALRMRADLLFERGRYAEAEAAIDQALALRPAAGHLYVSKILYLRYLGRDLSEARALLAKMPAAYLLDDLGAYTASMVWLWSRDPDNCLIVLGGLPHDYLDCRFYIGPKAFLTGQAHQMAGRTEAALADWRIALQKTEQWLTAEPGAERWLRWKAELLAVLGERAQAEGALRVYEQLMRIPSSQITPDTWSIYVALGRRSEVVDYFATLLQPKPQAWVVGTLRHDSQLDPLRGDPRFQQLLKDAEAAVAAPAPEVKK